MREYFLNGRGHIVLLKKHIYTYFVFLHYNGWCWYFFFFFSRTSAYLYANGRDGEYSETAYLFSKTVHSFTNETQVKRRAKEGGDVQATLWDMWAA